MLSREGLRNWKFGGSEVSGGDELLYLLVGLVITL